MRVLISSRTSARNICHFRKMNDRCMITSVTGVHARCQLDLSDCSETGICWTDYRVAASGQTDEHDDTNSCFLQFCESAPPPPKVSQLLWHSYHTHRVPSHTRHILITCTVCPATRVTFLSHAPCAQPHASHSYHTHRVPSHTRHILITRTVCPATCVTFLSHAPCAQPHASHSYHTHRAPSHMRHISMSVVFFFISLPTVTLLHIECTKVNEPSVRPSVTPPPT